MLADALLVGSAVLTASTVTVLGDGMVAGAVYLPVWSIVPVAAVPAVTLLTRQVTALTVVLVTVAWNTFWSPTWSVADVGLRVTATAGADAFASAPNAIKDGKTTSVLR